MHTKEKEQQRIFAVKDKVLSSVVIIIHLCIHRVKWRRISVVAMRSPFCRSTRRTVCSLNGEDLSHYSNIIESVGLRKCPYDYDRYLIEKVTSTDARITNISQSLPHKMAEDSWYEEITSLSPYVYTTWFLSTNFTKSKITTDVLDGRNAFAVWFTLYA